MFCLNKVTRRSEKKIPFHFTASNNLNLFIYFFSLETFMLSLIGQYLFNVKSSSYKYFNHAMYYVNLDSSMGNGIDYKKHWHNYSIYWLFFVNTIVGSSHSYMAINVCHSKILNQWIFKLR